jgi:hypothetical protein
MSAFVIAPEEEDGIRVPDLERPEVENTLDAEVPPINIISQKKVSGCGRIAANLEKFHKIIILTVNIATDSHWGVDMEEIGLGVEDLCSLLNDKERVVLFYSALSVEMVLEIGDVRLALFSFGKELVICRNVHGRGLDLFDDSFLGADSVAIFELVLGKVDIWDWTPALNLVDRAL